MILKGSQRSGGRALALHLLNAQDNDHITVHQLRGFLSDDLAGAFAEVEAVASGTRCVQPYFSVSVNPPPERSAELTDKDFRAAAYKIERAHGLKGHPRAIVFHEKDGRRHAHIVWSRIDAQTMTAKNLAHYKRKLMGVSKELFLEHGFDLPKGFDDPALASQDRVSLAEWQAAKRRGRNAIDQRQLIKQCWEVSDGKAAFQAALAEHGFALARGDRRGHVIVTAHGQIIAVARAVGVKTKEVRAKLGDADALPGVETARSNLAQDATARFAQAAREIRSGLSEQRRALDKKRQAQIKAHRSAREALKRTHVKARADAVAQIMPTRGGLAGLWDQITKSGQRRKDLRALKTRLDTEQAAEWHDLRRTQLNERRVLEAKRTELRRAAFGLVGDLRAERDVMVAQLTGAAPPLKGKLKDQFAGTIPADPRQTFFAREATGPVTDAQIRANPVRLLDRLGYFNAAFTERDISRALAKIFPDPLSALSAKKAVLAAPDLLRMEGNERRFTTRDYVHADTRLQSTSRTLLMRRCKAPKRQQIEHAVTTQNRVLAKFSAVLSNEQRNAVVQMTDTSRLSMVVGRAGTGKSTILAAANDAWAKAEITVHGAALSGKAAAGLQGASGIASRTLASLELSWANGHEPIKPGDVLVIDEAGMVGTRQLDRIAHKIDEIGTKLVLVGDPDQLPPIEAGQPFRGLIDRHGAAWLSEVHRQTSGWQKDATGDLAAGRITQAVAAYAAKGCVTPAPSQNSAIAHLTQDYLTDRAAAPDTSRLILAHRRRDVHALNQSVRETLKFAGDLAEGPLLTTDQGPREFAARDRVVFTANDRDIGVKNGILGTVRHASDTKITVDLDDGGRVSFDPVQFRSFDHGYAVTIHKSQGVTVDQAYVLASRTMDDPLTYVAMTRHRNDMRLYVSKEDRPTWQDVARPRSTSEQQPGMRFRT
ncbi:AAA family ATPase [uncultured Tateyamaria sp.]|uniref:AAA family ATPase n=1 Tax=uncultured Tateyamaria sp. TaxID=455651 RepID=UPI0026018AE6|nr:AAA family ATPase [uncultured Tateyamaria sp.]